MVANEYLSWRRKWSRVVPFADPSVFERDASAPDALTTLTDRAELVQRLARLPRRQRAVLALRYFEGLSDPEIAQTLRCGEGSVRSHASRGLSALRVDTGRPPASRAPGAPVSEQLRPQASTESS